MKRMLIAALLALLLPGMVHGSEDDREVWVFYLSFWAGAATWELVEPFMDDLPLIGRYNSKLPHVAAQQIQQARAAAIDAFLVSWFGVDEQVTTTPALRNLLDRAAEQRFFIGAVLDLYPDEFLRDPAVLERSLRWLVDELSQHPAYLHYQGRPLIAFAFQERAGFSSAQWRALREKVDPDRRTFWLAEGLNACCLHGGAMDGMYAFNMAWTNGNSDYYIAERNLILQRGGTFYLPSLSPGWDEARIAQAENRPRPTSPRDRAEGGFLQRAWDGALRAAGDRLLIVTWNEFMENSHIEPSLLYGTQALDLLREMIHDWKGYSAALPEPADDEHSCYVARPAQTAPLRPRPSFTGSALRFVSPAQTYPLLDEEGGFYQVDDGGLKGWLAAAHVRFERCA